MFCFPLTNWTTMRGASSVASITQSESQWLDLRAFEDVVFWLECKNITLPSGATNITLNYQSAPTKDEVMFTTLLGSAINLSAGSVTISKVLLVGAGASIGRWVRWQLGVTGAPSAAWDATFRVWGAANIGPHQLRPRIQAPALRPSGKSCNGDCQKGGSTPVSFQRARPAGERPAVDCRSRAKRAQTWARRACARASWGELPCVTSTIKIYRRR